jgi:hypothetical protein
MRVRPRHAFLALLIAILILLVGAAMMPWAFHIGGRWTPVLTWWGSGRLATKSGMEYPMFVMLYPSAHFSRLRLDGRHPTGGVQGNACLCTLPGVSQYLKLSGTIYDGWRSTDGSVMTLRLLEPTIVDVGQQRAGYFDLVGRWQGSELLLDERANWSRQFRSGLRIDHASVTLRWDPYWSCKSACASVANHATNRTD